MKALFILLLCFLLLAPATASEPPSPYIAVYCSEDLKGNWIDFPHKVQKFTVAKDWSNFDRFLQQVKRDCKGRPVVLDLCVHGMSSPPFLAVGNEKFSHCASEGGVFNHIDKYFGAGSIIVVQESCYGGWCFKYGLLSPFEDDVPCCMLEKREKGAPAYPVYGFAGFYRNVPPCALEQYLHKKHTSLEDLRHLEKDPVERLSPLNDQLMTNRQRLILLKFQH